jgi:hypothetical protein
LFNLPFSHLQITDFNDQIKYIESSLEKELVHKNGLIDTTKSLDVLKFEKNEVIELSNEGLKAAEIEPQRVARKIDAV